MKNNTVNLVCFPVFSWILENKTPEVSHDFFKYFFQRKNCLILLENILPYGKNLIFSNLIHMDHLGN